MEELTLLASLALPPFVAYLFVMFRRIFAPAFYALLFVMAFPVFAYLGWASQKLVLQRPDHFQHPFTLIGSAFLIVLTISLSLTTIWHVRRNWMKALLAPVIYLLSLLLALVVGENLGMIEGF